MKNYIELINKHCGNNSFVLGAGPSLWFNMNESFFKEIKNYGIVISVNSSVLAFPDFNYWISNDSLCRNWSWWKDVKKSKGEKIVRNSWLKYKNDIEDFYIFEPRKTTEGEICPEDIGLCYSSSVSSAIDISIQMGCKNIFVLGLDHNTIEGKHHFWQFFKEDEQPKQLKKAQWNWIYQQKVFPIHLKSYNALQIFADYKNCRIYNCSESSNVNVFKKIKFREINNILK